MEAADEKEERVCIGEWAIETVEDVNEPGGVGVRAIEVDSGGEENTEIDLGEGKKAIEVDPGEGIEVESGEGEWAVELNLGESEWAIEAGLGEAK